MRSNGYMSIVKGDDPTVLTNEEKLAILRQRLKAQRTEDYQLVIHASILTDIGKDTTAVEEDLKNSRIAISKYEALIAELESEPQQTKD